MELLLWLAACLYSLIPLPLLYACIRYTYGYETFFRILKFIGTKRDTLEYSDFRLEYVRAKNVNTSKFMLKAD